MTKNHYKVPKYIIMVFEYNCVVLLLTCDWRQFGGFLRYAGFLYKYNWPLRFNWNIVESGVKHHKPLLTVSLGCCFELINTNNKIIIVKTHPLLGQEVKCQNNCYKILHYFLCTLFMHKSIVNYQKFYSPWFKCQ